MKVIVASGERGSVEKSPPIPEELCRQTAAPDVFFIILLRQGFGLDGARGKVHLNDFSCITEHDFPLIVWCGETTGLPEARWRGAVGRKGDMRVHEGDV